jgi:predicted CoA-binding protein
VPVDEIVEGAIDREDVSVVWTHLDVRDDEAARRARDAGLIVVQDRSIAVEHRRLFG